MQHRRQTGLGNEKLMCSGKIITAIVFCFILSKKAYAYLDPGTVSYLLHLLIAALIGGLFAIRLFWNKIKIFFNKLFSRRKKHEKAED